MKFSGKMCLMIILKVPKNQGFTLCLEDTVFEKPQGWDLNWFPSPPAVLGLRILNLNCVLLFTSHCFIFSFVIYFLQFIIFTWVFYFKKHFSQKTITFKIKFTLLERNVFEDGVKLAHLVKQFSTKTPLYKTHIHRIRRISGSFNEKE